MRLCQSLDAGVRLAYSLHLSGCVQNRGELRGQVEMLLSQIQTSGCVLDLFSISRCRVSVSQSRHGAGLHQRLPVRPYRVESATVLGCLKNYAIGSSVAIS